MEEKKEPLLVQICRQPDSGEVAEIEISSISNVRWDDCSGGYQNKRGYYSLFGYIPYSIAKTLEGLDCSGRHDRGGNSAKVCIHKPASDGKYYEGYKTLKAQAGKKPESKVSANRPAGMPPCTRKILEILRCGERERGGLREDLLQLGYKPITIAAAIRRLNYKRKIVTEGSPNSFKQKIRTLEHH